MDTWRGTAPVDDASLAVYLGELFEAGRAPATAALAVAAVRFRAKLAGQPAPAGEATARVLGGYRRTAADRGRGQAAPLRADGLAAILATAARPRTDGRGVESPTTAHRRGRLDAVIRARRMTDTPRLWDRRADETPKSYAAFRAYVALGARRSVREAAHQNHIKTISTGEISSVEDTTVRTWLGWSARGRLAKLEGVDRLRRLRMCRSSGTGCAMIAAVTGVAGGAPPTED